MPATYRVHRQAAATLVWQPTDSEGEPITATGTPTVTVTRGDGTALVPASGPSIVSGAVILSLTAAELSIVDRLTVTWLLDAVARGTSTVDVVGGVYLTVAEIRALEPSMSDPSEFPAATLQRCRREVEARFERSIQAVAFVPRLSVYRFNAKPYATVILPHFFVTGVYWARYWLDNAWTSLTTTDVIVSDTGVVRLDPDLAPWGTVVEVGYVHGLPSPPDLSLIHI